MPRFARLSTLLILLAVFGAMHAAAQAPAQQGNRNKPPRRGPQRRGAPATIERGFRDVDFQRRVQQAAIRLLNSFPDHERVVFPFDSQQRQQWTNLPVGIRPRTGVSIGEMTDKQKLGVHALLSELLSSQGYLKTTGVMHLDNILQQHFDIPRLQWSHKNYYLSFWGDPRKSAPWAFKVEGHHLTLNFTFADGRIAVTPMFLGTDPAEVKSTEYAGWRVLGQEEDLGFLLVNSLRPEQQKVAVLQRDVPRDILTGPDSSARLHEYWGIARAELDASQQRILDRLVREYVNNLEHEKAEEEIRKIRRAGEDKIHFAWIGDTKSGSRYYYLIHGPTFIIEYDNPRNHVHSIWRSKDGDFGADILKHHLEHAEHHRTSRPHSHD